MDLLVYSRIIDKIKVASFGGNSGQKGTLYLLNPMVGWYYGIFTKNQIANLCMHIKENLEKDNKVQFNSLDSFDSKFDTNETNSCPVNQSGNCINPLCGDSYNELWTMCPFHPNISLEHIEVDEKPEKNILTSHIDVLNFSERMNQRLKSNGINTIKDILEAGMDGLKKITFIKEARANNILYSAKEYVDDNA